MSRRIDKRIAILCVVAIVSTVAAVVLAAAGRSNDSGSDSHVATGPAAGPGDHLPDLDQEAPTRLQVRALTVSGKQTYRLGFRSAVRNVGAGPLLVTGSRPNLHTPFMTVDQHVIRAGKSPRVVREVGLMRYTISPDHRHWHYLQFERYELQQYELRRAGSDEALVSDRKTGFCLGDRYRVTDLELREAAAKAVYTSRCGLNSPERLHMREGISVGWGDDYAAFLEGQELPLDGIPAGRYVLVHRVNAGRRLEELSYANNAASVLLDLRWRDGRPVVSVEAVCPDTEECGT